MIHNPNIFFCISQFDQESAPLHQTVFLLWSSSIVSVTVWSFKTHTVLFLKRFVQLCSLSYTYRMHRRVTMVTVHHTSDQHQWHYIINLALAGRRNTKHQSWSSNTILIMLYWPKSNVRPIWLPAGQTTKVKCASDMTSRRPDASLSICCCCETRSAWYFGEAW